MEYIPQDHCLRRVGAIQSCSDPERQRPRPSAPPKPEHATIGMRARIYAHSTPTARRTSLSLPPLEWCRCRIGVLDGVRHRLRDAYAGVFAYSYPCGRRAGAVIRLDLFFGCARRFVFCFLLMGWSEIGVLVPVAGARP